jgi:signal transduction histidine kinase
MVSSFLALLQQRYQGRLDADADEFIAYAVDGATRMQQLIRDLLAYARMGGQLLQRVPVSCDQVIAEVCADLQEQLTASEAVLTTDTLPTVLAEAASLRQVFQNLLSNALKFRGAAPLRIHITARRVDEGWEFTIRDNGIGIAPQDTERIFRLFQRGHPRSAYPGTGLGLAICKKIVERHGGRLWVTSQPGTGSTFYFTLPAAAGEG